MPKTVRMENVPLRYRDFSRLCLCHSCNVTWIFSLFHTDTRSVCVSQVSKPTTCTHSGLLKSKSFQNSNAEDTFRYVGARACVRAPPKMSAVETCPFIPGLCSAAASGCRVLPAEETRKSHLQVGFRGVDPVIACKLALSPPSRPFFLSAPQSSCGCSSCRASARRGLRLDH